MTREVGTGMSWWDSYQAGNRAELMAGAIDLADRGWPVLPGTFWQSDRWTGIPDAPQPGPVSALTLGTAGASCDRQTVTGWWSELPYSVLVATGSVVDVIEVSALVGRRLCEQLRVYGVAVPVGASAAGRWWFAVSPGEALRPELASRADVTLHGRGSWVVAPPTGFPEGGVHWRVPPSAAGRTLPDTYDVQVVLLDVLGQRPVLAAATAGSGAVGTGVHRWP
ncbi:MAG: bifunctional DNA primase/polymerase [Actinomycetota bacterium]|nr:bifunctional DNA primase/polymerase [Actinomycetota bacterium]